MCDKVFYAMNNFGIAHFSLFVIDAWKYIFKAIKVIPVAFIHKIEVFSKIFIREITIADLAFFTYFYFQHCPRNNITNDI